MDPSGAWRVSVEMKLAVLVLVVAAGCQHKGEAAPETGHAAAGHERGDCRPDKTCDSGLWCLSNLCVRPPAADCKLTAETLASIDLGNYAEPEVREPAVAQYKAECERLYVSKDEGKCLEKRTTGGAPRSACADVPDRASSGSGDCEQISMKIKTWIEKQANYVNNPQMKKWFDTTIRVVKQSCVEDNWPDNLKKCVLGSDVSQNPAAMQGCTGQTPPALQQKMQERLTKAMQDMQRGG
jgi:hypothetical protein